MLIGGVARVGRVELHGRDQLLQAVHVEGAGVSISSPLDHRHGNRHFLRDLLDAPRGDDHAFGEARGRQGHVDRRGLTDLEHDLRARPSRSRRARLRRGSGRARAGRRWIRALLVADRLDRGAGALVDDANRGAGNRRPRRIADDAGDVPVAVCAVAGPGSATTSATTIVNNLRDIDTPHRSRAPAIKTAHVGGQRESESLVEGVSRSTWLQSGTGRSSARYTRADRRQRRARREHVAGECKTGPADDQRNEWRESTTRAICYI